jgi:hypothetical protein
VTDFGRDISCTDSLRTGRFSTGVRLVAEAVYRRLITPRGMLRGGEEDADYGLDLTDLIGSTNAESEAASLPDRIRAELLKDERIESVAVTLVNVRSGPGVTLLVTVEAVTGLGPFTLQLRASEVSVELLGIS